jgi:transcriptional regulator with PAS, ATPase and Fis domain
MDDGSFPEGYVKGISDAITVLYLELSMLSKGDFSILLLGETGVGKEHLARIIHAWSDRNRGPFFAVNCAAIPNELFEAEMFGIGKGVATGVQERKGYFQLAEKGTLFLDEIGELGMASQAKLLRALQDIEVRRVGGSSFKRDVRIIAATNADLRNRMEEGAFRPDLYYRVAGFELHVPPLRQRREDIPLLIEHFLKIFSQEAGKSISSLTPETLKLLTEYSWPGNIRELESELRRVVYLCPDKQTITATLLSTHILLPKVAGREHISLAPYSSLLLRPHIEELERRLLRQALAWSRGNHSKAAKLLGISRNGLASKIAHLGIED